MRYRTRGTLLPRITIPYLRLDPTCDSAGSWVDAGSNVYGIRLGEVSEMYDVVTPNFRARQAKGELIFNPMSSVSRIYTTSGGQGYHARAVSPSCSSPLRFSEAKRDGDQLQAFVPKDGADCMIIEKIITDSEMADIITEAATACLNQRGRSDTNLWETVAEARKSLKMYEQIANNGRKIVNSVIQTQGERVQKAKFGGASIAVSSMYLLYRYGFQPVMRDLVTVLENLAQGDGKARKSTRITRTKFANAVTGYEHTHGSFKTSIVKQKSDSLIVRAVSIDEFFMTEMSNIGFTTKGLVTLPWELLRLSFVIDWFLNMGDLLGALAPAPGYTQVGSCQTYERVVTNSYTATGTVCHDGTNTVLRPVSGTVSGTVRTKVRSGLALPGLVVKSDFKFNELTRALDATALIVQSLKNLRAIADN